MMIAIAAYVYFMEVTFMDKTIEIAFVKTFINKRMQDRILYELLNTQKRRKIISRLANAEEILDSKKVFLKSNKITDDEVAEKLLKYNKITDLCYVISCTNMDGEFCPFKEALQGCLEDYMPSILICGRDLALVKGEVEKGSPTKYILKNV